MTLQSHYASVHKFGFDYHLGTIRTLLLQWHIEIYRSIDRSSPNKPLFCKIMYLKKEKRT